MKLLQHTARYQLLFAIPLVLVGTAIGYFSVRHIVNEELDEQLEHQAAVVQVHLNAGQDIPQSTAPDQSLMLTSGKRSAIEFRDSLVYDIAEQEMIPWRLGLFPVKLADGTSRTLTLGRATVEFDDLVVVIALTIGAVLMLLFFGNVLLNRWLNGRLWEPFHRTLAVAKEFRMEGPEPPPFPATHVDEFRSMNATLTAMMSKLRKDYSAQKRFSEQAAHELQTPLAIMQGKLDELIQMPELGKLEADMIEVLYRARERMGRTVSNMLLLARIGNQEFTAVEVDWAALFQEQHAALAELIEKHALHFTIHKEHHCHIRLHPVLAELIAANLLRNAVQHNHEGGHVNVWIGEHALEITNSGPVLAVDPDSLFDRFAKGDPSSSGSGLGLSMVKEICDNAGLVLIYTAVAGVHTVVVRAR